MSSSTSGPPRCSRRARRRRSLNLEGSYRHILTDLYGFIATAIAAGVILSTGFRRADAIASLLIAGLMLAAAVSLLRASGRVFMEAAPEGLDPSQVGHALAAQAGVVEVHDLHVWEVTSGFPALSAHVVVGAGEDCHGLRRTLRGLLPRALRHRAHDASGGPRGGGPAAAADRGRAAARTRGGERQVKVIKPQDDREVPRGVLGGAEISQGTAGASGIYMGVFRVPPKSRSHPHYHAHCETAVYMLSGSVSVRWGEHLEEELTLEPGDLVYVPPRETHILENTSENEAAEYVAARNSPHEDAVVVPWAEAPA